MSFKVEVVADSVNEWGKRITTMVLTYPRIIHAEFLTHRAFSKNTASSRAIPFEKMLKSIQDNPFTPIAWQKGHSGMQGTEYFIDGCDINTLNLEWLRGRDEAITCARVLSECDVTKQICNRLLEPFMWVTCIVTATDWENFFALRCPRYSLYNDARRYWKSWKEIIECVGGDESAVKTLRSASVLEKLEYNKGQAEIHMMHLAEIMYDAYNESVPQKLLSGQWHIPYESKINEQDIINWVFENYTGKNQRLEEDIIPEIKVKISTVMAARTSYTVIGQDQKPLTYQRMIELYDDLVNADPIHASPTEHCAQASGDRNRSSRNFNGGWIQYREIVENEKSQG